jgi:acyl-CoA synthetase (AMP-forming)/AMP-acid ligase II
MNNVYDFLFSETKANQNSFLLNPGEEISFAELYKNCTQLASYIQTTFGKGNCILLISHNNLFFVKSYLAILKSGNIVVPLNPATDEKNLGFIKDQCGSKVAFVSKFIRIQTETIETVISESSLESLMSLENNGFVEPILDSNEPAEIIYTSGSTGLPKGVVLSHKNLIANTSSIIQYLNLLPNDRMLVVLPFYYCYGLSLLHTHLRVGGSIVFNNSFIFLGGILRDLNQYKCTGFAGVPSHYQVLLRKSKTFTTSSFPFLRYVTQAGGKLSPVFISEFIQAFPQISFYVMYGQTEATARLSFLPPEMLREKLGSIGKGIPDVTLRVVNEKGIDVKPDEPGEIIAKGDNVMKEYYKDPALTSATIKNGWLYTGDIAIVDKDGYIFIQSRIKDFIKVGGKRISPKEIEDVILSMPEVIDCTIVSVNDDILGEAMKAIVVLTDDKRNTITVKDISNHCQKNLPLYKVPTYIEFDTVIKVNAAGKKTKNQDS